MANWTNPYPSWGDTGEQPSSGFQYDGGDQVNEKHIDYLWDQANKVIDNVLAHTLQDDGSVKVDNGATAIPFADDAGAGETLFDMSVTSTPTAGTEQSITADIDGTSILKFYAEADGSGSIQNTEIQALSPLDLSGNDLIDGATTVWDTSAGHIPLTSLEADSITVTAGDGLKTGGSVTLGGSVTVDIEPADFAGTNLEDDGSDNLRIAATAAGNGLKGGGGSALAIEPADFAGLFLADDGSDNIDVQIGSGLHNDGSGNVAIDESASLTWSSLQTFSSSLNVSSGTIQVGGVDVIQSVAANGQVALSGGTAIVSTGITAANATFLPALGIDDPDADTKVSSRLFWDDSAGEYKLEIVESGTAVGNPTINYKIIRVD